MENETNFVYKEFYWIFVVFAVYNWKTIFKKYFDAAFPFYRKNYFNYYFFLQMGSLLFYILCFIPVLTWFSLESEWQHVFSDSQYSSKNSSQFQHFWWSRCLGFFL